MKKARILIISLVCAVMLMGIGYAYWSDAITFTGTASTGTMSVVWTADSFSFDAANAGVAAVATSFTDDQANCAITNAYPGAKGTLVLKLKNTGSIPVKVATAPVTIAGALAPALQAKNTASASWTTFDAVIAAALPADLQIAPDQEITIPVDIQIDPTITGLQGSSVSFSAIANFKQFNQ